MALRRKIALSLMVLLMGITCSAQRISKYAPAANNDGQIVRLWNQIAIDAIVGTGANAPASSGVLMAIVQLGVYDAVVAITGGDETYAPSISSPPSAAGDAPGPPNAPHALVAFLSSPASPL